MLAAIRTLFSPAEEKQPDPVCFLAGNDTRLAPIKNALTPFGLRGEQFASLPRCWKRPPNAIRISSFSI